MKIVFSPKSTEHIRNIQEYTKDYSIVFDKIMNRFNLSLKIIKNHPQIGKIGRKEGTYEFFVNNTNYFIVYRITSNSIEIVAFLHTSRKY